MPKSALIILTVLLSCLAYAEDARFNVLKGKNGEITYLVLGNDINRFLNQKPAPYFPYLQMLVITEVDNEKEMKRAFPKLLKFLNQHQNNLKHLHFTNIEENKSDLGMEELTHVLAQIPNAPLISFKWEKQNELDESISEKSKSHFKIFERLEELSFANTAIDGKALFEGFISYKNLTNLNLDQSLKKSRSDLLKHLFTNHTLFPKLERLNINNANVRWLKIPPSESYFPNLKHFSSRFSLSPQKILDKDLFTNKKMEIVVEEPFTKPSKMPKRGHFTLFDLIKMNKDTESDWLEFKTERPKITLAQNYTAFSLDKLSKITRFFNSIETNPKLFFTTKQNIKEFITKFPLSNRETITLVGPKILPYSVNFIFNNIEQLPQLRRLILIGVSCSEKEIKQILKQAGDHKITVSMIDEVNYKYNTYQYHYNQDWFHLQHIQMMQQQMEFNINNIKIPKHR